MYGSSPINVYLDGQRFGGWWEMQDGKVLVSSAWGSRPAKKPGRRKPEVVAKELLEEIVKGRQPGAVTASGSRRPVPRSGAALHFD